MSRNMSDVRIEIHNPSGTYSNDRPRDISVKVKRSHRRDFEPLELKAADLSKVPRMMQNYAYENPAFEGNMTSQRRVIHLQPPIDTVYREQYCVCSRWPLAKKILAVAVGLLFGTAVGLTLSMTLPLQHGDNLLEFPLLRGRSVPG